LVFLGLIWNALGCYNFILQMDPGALAASPDAYQVVIASRSGWVTAAFLIAIFGGALGCVLMLLRRTTGAAGFVSFAYWRGADNGPCAMGGGCGAWGLVSGHFKRPVFGRGGWFGVVHASQGWA
jgi:hypothetical protein